MAHSAPPATERWAGVTQVIAATSRFTGQSRASCYECGVVHGLLQVSDYAKIVIGSGTEHRDAAQAQAIWDRRKRWQAMLKGPGQFRILLDRDAVTRNVGGPGVMRQQLDHVVAVAQRPNVEIRIIEGWYPGCTHAYNVMQVAAGDAGVYYETWDGDKFNINPDLVIRHLSMFERAWSRAFTAEESLLFLRRTALFLGH